jgi:hypothetical protein
MRLILSRKGFDSSYGGMPSPILPDGRLVPLPIPARHDSYTLNDLLGLEPQLEKLVSDLSRGRVTINTTVHVDPDLSPRWRPRVNGWRPALGQTGAAQTHLAACGVGADSVFLFFGWFREVESAKGRWRFVPRAPHLHVIFGWLEVAEVLSIVSARAECLARHPWISGHPHVIAPDHYTDARNALYVARKRSRYSTAAEYGGGYFPRYLPSLRLTLPGSSRSVWSLPSWFMPRADRAPLSYHAQSNRWQKGAEGVTLRSVAKGQEFVLNMTQYPEADGWLRQVVRSGVSG